MKDEKTHDITIYVDDEPHVTREKTLTPVQILAFENLTSPLHYLVQIVGNEEKSFKDQPDTPLHIHENMRFSSVYTGQTPVSASHL